MFAVKCADFTSALAAFQSGCKALKHDLWCSSCFPFSCCYFLGKNILSRDPTPCYILRRCPIHSEGNCTALLLDCLLLSKARLLLLSCAKSCAIFKAAFLFFLSFFFFYLHTVNSVFSLVWSWALWFSQYRCQSHHNSFTMVWAGCSDWQT